MKTKLGEDLDDGWKLQYNNQFCNVYINAEQKFAICEATEPYIPINDFMATFNKIGEFVKAIGIQKLIFDKRMLRAFHQPSMEWYFIVWKTAMMDLGLKVHRKILPEEEWFKKCVEAGRADILKSYPDSIIHLLDIQYCKNVKEAIAT